MDTEEDIMKVLLRLTLSKIFV